MWQVELDPYCRRVLEKHFPHAQRFDDVRTVGKHNLPWVDIISGGFPCQDISNAGKRAGIDGERSGLWSEYARIVRELRPRYVVVENVAALLGRGMERVLGDLAACGYDAEWQSIRASDVGAPHRRERIWIVAYPNGERSNLQSRLPVLQWAGLSDLDGSCGSSTSAWRNDVAYSQRAGRRESTTDSNTAPESLASSERTESPFIFRPSSEDVAYAKGQRWSGEIFTRSYLEHNGLQPSRSGENVADAEEFSGELWPTEGERQGRLASSSIRDSSVKGLSDGTDETLAESRTNTQLERSDWWAVEPDVGRVVARLSPRMDGGGLSDGTNKILYALRNGVSAQTIQWPTRGLGSIQTQEILLTALCEYQGKTKSLGNVSLASKEASWPIMRGVWFDGTLACPSCRRESQKQRQEQYPDFVHLLSWLLACDCGATWLDPTGTPSESSRVDRLKGLGNAIVPQIAEWIGRRILANGSH